MLTDSPLIKGLGIFSLEEVFGAVAKASAKEIRCRCVAGGATTIVAEIGGVEGEDNSTCQSNGMAAVVRQSSRKNEKVVVTKVRSYGQHVLQPL